MSTVRTQIWVSGVLMVVSSMALLLTLIGWPADLLHVGTGLVLVWFAPGYALLLALFSQKLDRAWHIALSLPASIVVVILIGALLDLRSAGLADANFVWALWTVSLFLMVGGLLRLRLGVPQVHAEKETDPAASLPRRRWMPTAIGWAALTMVLIGTIWWSAEGVGAALQVTSTPFTALAITHSTTKSQPPQVVVANREGMAANYTLECWLDGQLVQRWDTGTITQEQQWQIDLPEVASAAQAELKLFRVGETQPYRTARVLLQPR